MVKEFGGLEEIGGRSVFEYDAGFGGLLARELLAWQWGARSVGGLVVSPLVGGDGAKICYVLWMQFVNEYIMLARYRVV
jgi:hypothetical protein